MKVEFHWERELSGLIVHSAKEVQVNLLNDDGSIPSGGGKLELHWEYRPAVPLWGSSGACSAPEHRPFAGEERAAFVLPLGAEPEAGLARIDWTLKDERWQVCRGSWLRVNRKALDTQRWALRSLVLLLVIWALLVPNLKGTFEYFNGLLVFFAGGVGLAAVRPFREFAAQLLLRRRAAFSCILLSAFGLLAAVLCFRKVYNLSLEACYFGDVLVEPKSAALVWYDDKPQGCAAVPTDHDSNGSNEGPHHNADVGGVVAWLPLFSRAVQCATDVPDSFRDAWLKSGRCRPDTLESVIDVDGEEVARGKATLAYAAELRADALLADSCADPWSLKCYDRVPFSELRGLEVDARGHRGIARVAYEPFPEPRLDVYLPMQSSDNSGGFDFLLGGQRLGSVTIQDQLAHRRSASGDAAVRRPELACAKLAPAVGIQSILLGTESLQRYYRTAITHAEGAVFAPICFDQGRHAAEAIITFAPGWSPRTAHRIELPCDMLPSKLRLQTADGEWLGTIESRAPSTRQAGACWLNVQAVGWAGIIRSELRYPARPSSDPDRDQPDVEVSVPARTSGFGSIAWSVVPAPNPPGPELPLIAVQGTSNDIAISSSGEMQLRSHPAPSYIYVNRELVRGQCPKHSVAKVSDYGETLARNRELSFSTVWECESRAAVLPVMASRR